VSVEARVVEIGPHTTHSPVPVALLLLSTTGRDNEQLLLAAPTAVRGWLIPFASRIVVFAPQQNCGR